MEDSRSLTSAPATKTPYTHAILLSHECPEAYATLRDHYYQQFQPATQPETDLVDQMIAATWRLRRIAALEAAALNHTLAAQRPNLDETYNNLDPETRTHIAFEQLDGDSPILATYQRYQNAQLRHYDRAFRNLRILQAERQGASPK